MTEVDVRSPDWLDGFQTAEAERCHDWREALAELLTAGPENLSGPHCGCPKCLTYREARAHARDLLEDD